MNGLAILLLMMMTAVCRVHISALWILLYMLMFLMFAQGLGWIVAGLHGIPESHHTGTQIVKLLWFYFTLVLYTWITFR